MDVYFFHTSYRCESCEAIKSETKKNLTELFGDDVYFGIYNLGQEGKEKALALGVKTLTLVAVKGDVKINLTNEGYMYARSDPEKLRQVLEEKIKSSLATFFILLNWWTFHTTVTAINTTVALLRF